MQQMQADSAAAGNTLDSGLAALVLMLRFHGVAVEPAQISHQLAGSTVGVNEILRVAKDFKLKARAIASSWERLGRTALPAIAVLRDGSFTLIGKVQDDTALIHDFMTGRPRMVPRDEFMAQWNGRLVLMTSRASLSSLARRFDISWFLQAMHKYRRLLTEVLYQRS
jgi:ATP-binding cassette, subfamily B, bacterial HlyB/CyaB